MKKILHYCWFGKNKKNELIKSCIESWKKYCPDYEIKEWNEENFDINSNKFVKEAYKSGKWAFVSDYVRLYVLYKEGGIYVDTDLEITNNIDGFLGYDFFSGYESDHYIVTALMGAEKGNTIIEYLLKYYEKRSFIKSNGEYDIKPNTQIISELLIEKYSLELNNNMITINEKSVVFPKEYFCVEDRDVVNYSIHHFQGSWIDKEKIKEAMLLYKNQYNVLNEIINIKYDENKKQLILNKLKDKDVCIYGFGSIGKLLTERLEEMNINIIDFVENSKVTDKFGKEKKEIEAEVIIVCIANNFNNIIIDLKRYHKKEIKDIYDVLNLKMI